MKRYMWLLAVVLALTGCSGRGIPTEGLSRDAEPSNITVFAMDTFMELTAYDAEDALMKEAERRILDLEELLSVTRAESEISALNRDGEASLSPDTEALMGQALELCRRTEGALDISIYPVLRAWGFTTGNYQVPDDTTLSGLVALVDHSRVFLQNGTAVISTGMEVDLGSIAKGYAGDQVAQLLQDHGVSSALLNLGGNVQVVGEKPDGSPWRVGIQDPGKDGYLGVLELRDQAAITSGGYERCFTGEDGQVYWHIIDPKTGVPAHSGLVSVTVVGDSGTTCDALSTALFVMGLDKALEHWREYRDFDAVFVIEDGSVVITDGLKDAFSLADSARSLKVMT